MGGAVSKMSLMNLKAASKGFGSYKIFYVLGLQAAREVRCHLVRRRQRAKNGSCLGCPSEANSPEHLCLVCVY